MSAYSSLASKYDSLTYDVDYNKFINFYESKFSKQNGEFKLILDLCCGTGTLTALMSEKGYEMIGVDASEEMLIEAKEKCPNTLFLCQDAACLDLYGTVDAAVCALDSINYIKPKDFKKMLKRLNLFIRPGGLFIFDIRPEQWLINMDGTTSIDEDEDCLCIWRGDYSKRHNALIYGIDLFTRDKDKWSRCKEEHIEYIYSEGFITEQLKENGFYRISVTNRKDRLFFTSVRK